MPDAALSPDLQRFIARHIQSVEKLEILLLFFREPQRTWLSSEVFHSIQSSPASVNQKLDELVSEGFLARGKDETRFSFQPKTTTIRAHVEALDTAYRERRIKVIESIFSKTTEELRDFSNAFKLRKENE
jgi:DNA-binding IclR family transcriptional regulator